MFWADLSVRYPLLRGKMPLLFITVIGLSLALGFVAPREPLLSIGALVVLLLGIGILAKPDLATMVVIFVLYTNAAVVAVKFHNVPEMIGSSLPALLLIPLASYMIFRRGGLVITPVLPLIFLFMAVQVVGTLLAINIAGATTNLINFMIEGLGLYFLITNVVRTPEMLRRATWTLLAAGIFMGGLSFLQEVTKTYDNNYARLCADEQCGLWHRLRGVVWRRGAAPPGWADRRAKSLWPGDADAGAAGFLQPVGRALEVYERFWRRSPRHARPWAWR